MPAQKLPPAPVMTAADSSVVLVEVVDGIGQTLADREVHRVARTAAG